MVLHPSPLMAVTISNLPRSASDLSIGLVDIDQDDCAHCGLQGFARYDLERYSAPWSL